MLFLSPSCPFSFLYAHTQPHLRARLTGHTCVLESPPYISQRYTAALGLAAPGSCFRGLVIACKAQGIWDPLPEQGPWSIGNKTPRLCHCWGAHARELALDRDLSGLEATMHHRQSPAC